MITSEAVIEEIRASRRRMSEEAGHDPAKYIERLKAFNTKYAAQVERYRAGGSASLTKTAHVG
ncbi:MAG: hypothetical protein FJ279_27175 [Planctomycetes bacterium]|nr:hypothetical protein [Planctomycetota bacterium]